MRFLLSRTPTFSITIALVASASVFGCGGSGQAPLVPIPSQPVEIISQPVSTTVPLNATGTFTVAASGSPPLTYQWSKNGAKITGATEASYITPPIDMSVGGSTFTVSVSNSVNSIISQAATLTVGPRSPKPGDMRFQLVGSPALTKWTADNNGELMLNWQPQYNNAFASPLSMGDEICTSTSPYLQCGWGYLVFAFPTGEEGLSVSFKAGFLGEWETDLQGLNAPDALITSLDLRPADGAYGSEWLHVIGGQFDLTERVVVPGAIASTVAQDALRSRVITAVSFDAFGQAHLMSYGWQGDTSTAYDTQIEIVDPQGVADAAASLAGAGFIITAFGGNDPDGYVLVGTKVHGDTMPRPLYVYPQSNLPGRTWREVLRLTWVQYASGKVSSQGNEIVMEQ